MPPSTGPSAQGRPVTRRAAPRHASAPRRSPDERAPPPARGPAPADVAARARGATPMPERCGRAGSRDTPAAPAARPAAPTAPMPRRWPNARWRTAFPTVAAADRRRVFAALARDLLASAATRARRPRVSGATALPDFIADSDSLAGEPYLADSARLDWAGASSPRAAGGCARPCRRSTHWRPRARAALRLGTAPRRRRVRQRLAGRCRSGCAHQARRT